MRALKLDIDGKRPLALLCLGAHSDDVEIGCAGTVLEMLRRHRRVDVTWVVLSAQDERAAEARRSARALLRGATNVQLVLGTCTDGHFPAEFRQLKAQFEELKRRVEPDLILSHRLEDRHQDHRLIAELTWQTWRNALILEYEIPKYEGDLGQPNLFVPLAQATAARKVRHLMRHFGSQRSRSWFRPETFNALMHLRGVECRAPSGLAEAFHLRKASLSL
jgi:LmbE family N-acetylglucosaminyl deacetylase